MATAGANDAPWEDWRDPRPNLNGSDLASWVTTAIRRSGADAVGCIYPGELRERRVRTSLRMGYDSVAVLVT